MTIKNIRPQLRVTIDSGIFKGAKVVANHYTYASHRVMDVWPVASHRDETCIYYQDGDGVGVLGDYNDFGAIVTSLAAGLLYSEDDVTTVVTS
jgi:hypothetical protein